MMKKIQIQHATTTEQIYSCFPIIKQLRLHLKEEAAFVEQVHRQLSKRYQLYFLQKEDVIHAVAGFRFLEFLAWGKVLYIDDLITDGEARKKGYGSYLLTWIIEEAKNANCAQVHLDSGPQRHDAHRMYSGNS